MYKLKEVTYGQNIPYDSVCLMGADIGGTNSNFGFFQIINNKMVLLFSLHAKSKEITNFTDLVREVLAYAQAKYRIIAFHSCFAGAGVVSARRDYCKPTNLSFGIDAKEILAKTSLHCAIIANDFEVIGHGLAEISPDKLVLVNKGVPREHAARAIVGAGTGLGKCALLWDAHHGRYMPLVSEGGHADFPATNQLELELIEFIQLQENRGCHISWEDVLSGNGIGWMYHFFKARDSKTPANNELVANGLYPDEIFNSRNLDAHAWHTFALFANIYARCAKDFALDVLALGGVFIAGGIAAKNLALFQDKNFMTEFANCGKQQNLLMQVPIYIIMDYNVSLYGAVAYMELEGLCD